MAAATSIATLVGKNVQIYPGDTYGKNGTILDMDANGVLFEITDAHERSGYKAGEVVYIAYSAKLTFKLANGKK